MITYHKYLNKEVFFKVWKVTNTRLLKPERPWLTGVSAVVSIARRKEKSKNCPTFVQNGKIKALYPVDMIPLK